MIDYFDSSAFVKRYVVEVGTDSVMALLRAGSAPAIARIGQVEAAAAIARRTRDGALTAKQRDRLLGRVAQDFTECRVIELTAIITRLSIRLLRRYPLRAADSIHLASAVWLRDGLDGSVRFVCADTALERAARAEGLDTLCPGAD